MRTVLRDAFDDPTVDWIAFRRVWSARVLLFCAPAYVLSMAWFVAVLVTGRPA